MVDLSSEFHNMLVKSNFSSVRTLNLLVMINDPLSECRASLTNVVFVAKKLTIYAIYIFIQAKFTTKKLKTSKLILKKNISQNTNPLYNIIRPRQYTHQF